MSKCLYRNLLIGAVYKDHEILLTLKRCFTLSLRFQTRNTAFILFYDSRTYENNFRLFEASANKTKAVNLKMNLKHLQMIEVNKNEKPRTMTPAGAERRKKWLSSTSRHRQFDFIIQHQFFFLSHLYPRLQQCWTY